MLVPMSVNATVQWQQSEIVIVISMDGIRHDYPDRQVSPGFSRMQAEGLRAKKLIPTFPSNTFPGHASLATGTLPERHGIIDNTMWDKKTASHFKPEESHLWLEAEPIWISAERQGKKAATYYWLGSEGAWRGKTASYFKTPFKGVSSEQIKLDQIEQWLDMPVDRRPSLIMAYWHGADSQGHLYGPNSSQVLSQFAEQDAYLQKLQAMIDQRKAWEYVTLIVVSDHGMSLASRRNIQAINLPAIFKQEGINVYLKKSNAIAHVNLKRDSDLESALKLLQQQKGFAIYHAGRLFNDSQHEFSELLGQAPLTHPTRSGDLVLLAKKGYFFSSKIIDFLDKWLIFLPSSFLSDSIGKGIHGLSPYHPDMAAILFAQGRGVPQGAVLAEVNMIDVAPSIAQLLGIEPPLQATGKSIFPILEPSIVIP